MTVHNCFFRLFVVFAICFFSSTHSFSQSFLDVPNLSNVKVDQISQAQLVRIQSEIKEKQMSMADFESTALSKGMPRPEFSKLKMRLENLTESEEGNLPKTETIQTEKEVKGEAKPFENAAKRNVFGSQIFSSPSLSFEPNSNMPAPDGYVLGPSDELQILVYGIQQMAYTAKINSTGTVAIPNVGEVQLSGLTLEAGTSRLKSAIGQIYTTVRSGGSKVSVGVSSFKTIQVTLIGVRQPGNYRLSSMSSVFNALHVAGGPSGIGSYRKIELVRNNKVIRIIDLYAFISKGDQSDNLSLRDNDIIRVPAYENRIEINGEVKNPGTFEVLEGETLEQILVYAAGFTDKAYTNRISVLQKTSKEMRVVDLNDQNYKTYLVKGGDVISVEEILEKFENRIQVSGAVYRPGTYSLDTGMRILDLIAKADGILENYYGVTASLVRQKEDLTFEFISLKLDELLKGSESQNLILQKEDKLFIYNDYAKSDQFFVEINGEVRKSGKYPFYEGLTAQDLVLLADGGNEKASKKVSVYRIRKSDSIDEKETERIFSFDLEIDPLKPESSAPFPLMPKDIITVRRIEVYEIPQMITVIGEVVYQGEFALINKTTRVTDILQKSGDVKSTAHKSAIFVRRLGKNIPINYNKITRNPKSSRNVLLQTGDTLIVPVYSPTVTIQGEVHYPTIASYKKGQRFRKYVRAAGNRTSESAIGRSYVVKNNGEVGSVKRFLFFRRFPKVDANSTIYVVRKPEKEKLSTADIAALASIGATLTGMVAILLSVTQ